MIDVHLSFPFRDAYRHEVRVHGSASSTRLTPTATPAIARAYTASSPCPIPEPTPALAVDAQHIYWSWQAGPSEWRIGRDLLGTTTIEPDFVSGLTSSPTGLAVDHAYLYWTGTAAIGRVALGGGTPDPGWLATGAANPWGVAVDAGYGTHVYWTTGTGNTIGRAGINGGSFDNSFITGARDPEAIAAFDGRIYWSKFASGDSLYTSIARANEDGSAVNEDFIVQDEFTQRLQPYGLAVDARPFAPVLVTLPQLSGTPVRGQTLSCSTGTWSAVGTLAYSYRWLRDGVAIDTPPAASYQLVAADIGRHIACEVTADNDGARTTVTSDSVRVLEPPAVAERPVISGDPIVGQTLTCSTGAWYGDGPLTYAFQWSRDGVTIQGATTASYLLTDADAFHAVQCQVTATGPAGSSAEGSLPRAVNPRPAMAPANLGPPGVSGVAEAGQTLTCSPGTWSGSPPLTYAYHWHKDGVAISGLTATTYHATMSDVGHLIACEVIAANSAGHAIATSAGVRIRLPPDRVPPRLSAFALTPRSFRAVRTGPSIITKRNAGVTVSFRLTETASVTFTIEQALAGRRQGHGCLPDTRARHKLPRCTRYVLLTGRFNQPGHEGRNSFRFSGRLGNRTLKPGNYRLIATARDPARNNSKPTRASFTIRK